MHITNEQRQEWAATGLDAYGIAKERRADYDAPEDMASDLIADLLHLCVGHGDTPERAMQRLETARMNFEAEIEEGERKEKTSAPDES